MANIGVDLDSTVYHLDAVEKISKLYGLNYKSSENRHWDYREFPSFFRKALQASFRKPEFICNLKLLPHAKPKLEFWKYRCFHKIYIITARYQEVILDTVKMLNKDFGKGFFEVIEFTDKKPGEKLKYFLKYKLDFWIDDSPSDIVDSVNAGIKTFVIRNDVTNYNKKSYEDLKSQYPELVFGVKDFREINI